MSDAEAKARGLKPESSDGILRGETVSVGPGRDQVIRPDPGFDVNPGKRFFGTSKDLGKKLDEVENLRGPAGWNRPAASSLDVAKLPALPALLPPGRSDEFYLQELQRLFGYKPGEQVVVRDPRGDAQVISDGLFSDRKSRPVKAHRQGHGEYIPALPGLLADPWEIWLTPMQDELDNVVVRKRYVKVWQDPNGRRSDLFLVGEFQGTAWQGVTAYSPEKDDYLDRRVRRGVLLYAKEG